MADEARSSVDEDDDPTAPPTITAWRASSADPYAVSDAEARSYYAGLHSKPKLIYRTGKEKWSPPRGPKAQRRLKELCEVFTHPITKVWNHDLGWKVVDVMNAHTICFTTIDVVRFKMVEVGKAPEDEEDAEGKEDVEDEETVKAKKPDVGPVTIWIGVWPGSTSATAAHHTAQGALALLRDYQITDVDIDYRESLYMREAGPQLLRHVPERDPLYDVISPLTPAPGLRISAKARPNTQGTMALYLAEGGKSNNLLGLMCRHVLIGSMEPNVDYVRHPSAPSRDVLLLGERAFLDLITSIKVRIGQYNTDVNNYKEKIKKIINVDVEARAARIKIQGLLDEAEKAMKALGVLLLRIQKDWKDPRNRVLGHILRTPAIYLSVGDHRFTEDWGIFQVDRAKLGDGFQDRPLTNLNIYCLYLGTKLTPREFAHKCYPCGNANWKFRYPDDRLLPLTSIITDELMRTPDMRDINGDPCLLVVKNGHATDTTIGHATGIYSIIRDYFDRSVEQTSMEWAIINHDSKSEVFSKPGDSSAIIADIRGHIGGMLTGGSGRTESSDITYATPFWWLLQRIKTNGFPNARINDLV
ncbi:hypothetical protein ID866_4670 [Astraeus odoratus]|nr:hypothetical protein ID866_4670 [Astraeus odoratus]